MMRLYYSATSPYVRKVMVVAHEAGLISQIETVASGGSPLDSGTNPVALAPLGKIPALERPDGPAIYDSRVICRYLDDLGQAGLYPSGPALWDTLTIEATADGILDAALLMVYESRLRPEDLRFTPWIEGQWAKVERALDALEARWIPALGGPLDMGQIATGCALSYLDLRHASRNWRDGHPRLADWAHTFAERPSMLATAPPAA